METIQYVCLKPMVKIPKALSDFGITRNDMLEFIKRWWHDFCVEHGIEEEE